MEYRFLNIFLDKNELLTQSKKNINQFLLENNSSQIEKIYDFYKSNINLLYVNGFLGTGKAEIVDYSTVFLSAETIILKYNCFNSTVLDDILLSFFSEFKNLSAQNIISEPKIKTENFTQKINSYFSQIEKPFVIILDSFEAILEENRQEILDFIFHLNSMQKVKIIIIGRTFESKYFKDIKLERVTILALEKQIFEKYLRFEKIKFSSTVLDEFYKYTRGYHFFTAFSVKLIKNENLSLADFLTKLKNSFLPFHKFLEKQAITLIPTGQRNLFWFLSIIRHPVSIDLLKKLNFYDEEKINFLIKNLIIIKDNHQIYVQDYFKEEIDESIAAHILQRIHQYIIDLYLTQLPLKPLERDICISRQTMRKEIEYHKLFLPKKPVNIESPAVDINYLSYAKVLDFAGSKPEDKLNIDDKKTEHGKETAPRSYTHLPPHLPLDLTQRKNIKINVENLPFQNKEEEAADGGIYEGEEIFTLKEIMNKLQEAENRYDYAQAVDFCQKALLMKTDKDYQKFLPSIYTKIAYAYQKIADYENSLKYYELAQNFYEKAQNFKKVNSIKFNIAKIFYETYKIEKAREMFLEVAKSNESPASLIIEAYMRLANLEENLSNQQNAFEYYKLAMGYSNEEIKKEILSELYFKYALAMDDKNDIKSAIEFYNKCINLGGGFGINKFLSSAHSNIATLYLEKNDTENALKNYLESYEIDKQNNNLEGIYYSSSKLAPLLQRKQPEKALEYLNIALDSAKSIKDTFYTVSASLAIGDYYYDAKQNEIALKYYINALDLAGKNFSQDNINKINIRINDIKFRIGNEKFDKLVEIIKEQN